MNCPIDHKHAGSSTCYVIHKCRCEPCRLDASERERRRNRAKLYKRWVDPYMPVGPVREHVNMLRAYGMGAKRIAEVAGVGKTCVSQIVYGRKAPVGDRRHGEPLKRVLRVNGEKLLAVKPDIRNLRPGKNVPARGTVRRLQALVCMGWSQSKLGELLGVTPSNMSTLMNMDMVKASRHLQVAELYDRLWNQLPPHESWRDRIAVSRAKNMAKQRGWVPPLAWDDIDFDAEPPMADEPAGVDEFAVELAVSGAQVRLTVEEREEVVRVLHARRLSDPQIAKRAGCDVRTVLRIRQRLGLAAVVGADGVAA